MYEVTWSGKNSLAAMAICELCIDCPARPQPTRSDIPNRTDIHLVAVARGEQTLEVSYVSTDKTPEHITDEHSGNEGRHRIYFDMPLTPEDFGKTSIECKEPVTIPRRFRSDIKICGTLEALSEYRI